MRQRGFALILVLIFTAIALMVVTMVATALTNNIRLNRQSKILPQTYSLAQSGIKAGLNRLQQSSDTSPQWPSDACTGDYNIFYFDTATSNWKYDSPTDNLQNWLSSHSSANKDGFYAARMCHSQSFIEAIGFFEGRKLTLKAQIFHQGGSPTTHTDDKIRTYQTGS